MIKFLKKLFNIDSFVFNYQHNEPEYFPTLFPALTSLSTPTYTYTSTGGSFNNVSIGTSVNPATFTSTYTMTPSSDEIAFKYDEVSDRICLEMKMLQGGSNINIFFDKDAAPEMLASLVKIASEHQCIEDNPTLKEALDNFLMITKLSL